MIKEMNISQTEQFAKDLKKLSKKYKSLYNDFENFCELVKLNPTQHIRIEGIGANLEGQFYKVKKFRCQSLSKSSLQSGIRIIYCYREETGNLEFCEIEFIEMYHKNSQTDFDRTRLEKYRNN